MAKPGDVCNPYGDIMLARGGAATWGVVSIEPRQVPMAKAYGWQEIGASDGFVHMMRDDADRPTVEAPVAAASPSPLRKILGLFSR